MFHSVKVVALSKFKGLGCVQHPLSDSWIIVIIWLYIALNRTPKP